MLGDWLMLVDDDINYREHTQVLGITTFGNLIVNVVYEDGTIDEQECNEDCFEPIPLTKEILEKNFEKKTLYGIFDDYFDFEIREYNDSMYIINYHSCEMPIPDTQISDICFVHELQHALKFCGIEKEIEL